MKLEEKLKSMVNKIWMHNAILHKLLSFKITEDEVILVTDKKWITIPLKKINFELESFLPTAEENEFENKITVFQPDNKQSMKEVIADNIKRLQTNPAFISQAKEINNQVKTMVSMAKLELAILQMKKSK